jgi:hypothetical protein
MSKYKDRGSTHKSLEKKIECNVRLHYHLHSVKNIPNSKQRESHREWSPVKFSRNLLEISAGFVDLYRGKVRLQTFLGVLSLWNFIYYQ